MNAVLKYASLVKFAHTVFAMPFAMVGFVYGLRYAPLHNPRWPYIVLVQVILCMVFARNAAMGFNRWADRRIDAENPRTAGRVADVALRINPDIDPKTNHCIDTGQADSKFGISYEEVLEHAKEIRALKYINIIGLHLHIGSQIRELHVFENMCNKVNVIVENLEKLGCSFRFVDVGGGLGVNYDVPENEPIPNFASLFSIVHNHLSVGDREVHFEFGRSIVAECGELITKVLFNKTTATGRKLVIVDASMTELIRPALYGSYHNIENITSEDEARDKYTIVGTACESTDVFDENVTLRKTRRGDLLTIKSAGAYGMSMASRYNLHDLPGAVYSDEIQ